MEKEGGLSAPNIQLNEDVVSQSEEEIGANKTEFEADFLNEQQILDVAEEVFLKISDKMRENYTLSSLYGEMLEDWELNGEVVKAVSPDNFIESFKTLGITSLAELEIEWLLRVLVKPEINDMILFNDLVMILENFGVTET